MNFKTPVLSLVILCLLLATSCQYFDKEPAKKTVIRVEKPVTKVDITIDTSNAFNQMFIDSNIVNNFLSTQNLGDTMTNRLRSFYNSRNYQYGWFSPEGLPEHTVSFWNLLKNYLNYSKDSTVYNKKLSKKMEELIQQDSVVVKNDSTYQNLELELTKYFYLYADHAYADDPGFDMKSLEWYIPKKKLTVEGMLDSVLEKKGQYAEENAPGNPQYIKLREKLQKYKDIRDAGGWPVVNSKVEIMKKGYKDAAVKVLKQRLKIEGFMEGDDSTFTNTYTDTLAAAVNALKRTYGYKEDGTAGKTFLKEVNIPVEERIQQILINMERMRWIPTETKDTSRAIMVNIPEYKLHVYENGKSAWDMDVVVGKEGNNTTVFTGRLSTIVFSPYWNVPQSIAKKEIAPKGGGYMARNHYEYYNGGLIRQKPGPWNSLGLVKFLFPNSYDIYFHDSPAKALFNKDKRSYSHGCIRLKEPAKFAEYLLADTSKWSAEKVDSAMNSGKEKFVKIKKPLPVLITYFTAWVNDADSLNFREDVYGHDEIMAKKMFLNAIETTQLKPKKDSLAAKKDSSATKKKPVQTDKKKEVPEEKRKSEQ